MPYQSLDDKRDEMLTAKGHMDSLISDCSELHYQLKELRKKALEAEALYNKAVLEFLREAGVPKQFLNADWEREWSQYSEGLVAK